MSLDKLLVQLMSCFITFLLPRLCHYGRQTNDPPTMPISEALEPLSRMHYMTKGISQMELSLQTLKQGIVFVSVQPVCVLWLGHLIHLHLR